MPGRSNIFYSILAFGAWAGVDCHGIVAERALQNQLDPRGDLTGIKPRDCTHGPDSRGCWTSDFDINTDSYSKWPSPGRTRRYDWTITNQTCNPDGRMPRPCSLVNGQYPGPVLEADWGDMISVTIHNQLPINGTSIHWHGVRQLNNNAMDGTNGLTECPLPPGASRTYTFQATQIGTSWYHSHFGSQYGDGVLGPIVFHGPASANYDVDLGAFPVTDWYYDGAFAQSALQRQAIQKVSVGPAPDSVLINGTNGLHSGKFLTVDFEPGKRYRMRFVNTAVEDPIRVSIDNHAMQVISADFVPIKPVWADSIALAIGQRYDVIIHANQSVGNYWMRADVEQACSALPQAPAQAIVRYQGAPSANPDSSSTATSSGTCNDPGLLAPIVPHSGGNLADFKARVGNLPSNLRVPGAHAAANDSAVVWTLNTTSISVQWDKPVLQYVQEHNTSYPASENIIELPGQGRWTYWLLQDISPGQPFHPMHLHGHDFSILGSGVGSFDMAKDAPALAFDNPPRRDTANLPPSGWLAIMFPADNPGAWLFHCHITWHIAEGLGLQFLEAKDRIAIPPTLARDCKAWTDYDAHAEFKQEESGL